MNWTPLHPFYEHPDLSWTTPGEDCSCPDFFKLGDKHALLCISHKVGGRVYIWAPSRTSDSIPSSTSG